MKNQCRQKVVGVRAAALAFLPLAERTHLALSGCWEDCQPFVKKGWRGRLVNVGYVI